MELYSGDTHTLSLSPLKWTDIGIYADVAATYSGLTNKLALEKKNSKWHKGIIIPGLFLSWCLGYFITFNTNIPPHLNRTRYATPTGELTKDVAIDTRTFNSNVLWISVVKHYHRNDSTPFPQPQVKKHCKTVCTFPGIMILRMIWF